jgi:signal transduction histidine kinase
LALMIMMPINFPQSFNVSAEPEEYEGIGVGLAMVKHKIKRRNGCLWAERKGSDGATTYFTLHKQGFMLSSR